MPSASNTSERKAAPSGRTALLDIVAVAEVLGITPRHVRRLVAERRIPFFKVGRFVRFDAGELDYWLDQRRVDIVRRGSTVPDTAGS